MNKIVLSDDITAKINDDLTYEFNNDEIIKKLNIKIFKSTKLELNIKKSIKLDVLIEINNDVNCHIMEVKKFKKSKIHFKYNLKENCQLDLYKLHKVDNLFERNIVNFKEPNCKLNYVLKTVVAGDEKYDVVINHRHEKTNSNVILNGINESGNLEFNVTSNITKGSKGCIVEQNSRIINLNQLPCVIRPIMLIDEFDCIANHSALIGTFTDEEYFYLQRLGLDREIVTKLLLKGFIINKFPHEKRILTMYKKYWG